MTTWTMEQVQQARGLYARTMVDSETIARYGDEVRHATASKMAKALTRMAHPFAIELDERDFQVQWSEVEGEPWHMLAEMRWHPSTTVVEFRGGPEDGTRLQVQRVGDTVCMPKPPRSVFAMAADLDSDLSPTYDTYELAGWREDERVWVYESR